MAMQPEQQQILEATEGLACAYLPSINSGFLRGPGATCSLLCSCQNFFCLVVERLLWVLQFQDACEAGASSLEMTGV